MSIHWVQRGHGPSAQKRRRRSLGLGAGELSRTQQVTDLWIATGELMTGDVLFGRMGKDGIPGQTHRVCKVKGRCLDRQGNAQWPRPQNGGLGGQCGWKDQASHSSTPRPKPHPGIRRARRHAWEPAHVPSVLHGIQPSSIPEGRVLHHLVQEEHLEPTVAELEGEGLQPGDRLGWAFQTGVPFKAVRAFLSS